MMTSQARLLTMRPERYILTVTLPVALTCLLLLLLLAGCNTTRSAATSAATAETEHAHSEEALFASVVNNTLLFNTFSAALKIDVNAGAKSFASKATLKLVNTQRMQLSLQPLAGIEAFRLDFTPDSVSIIDRLHKQWTAMSYETLRRETGFNLNFKLLQALLTNGFFYCDNSETAVSELFKQFTTRRDECTLVFSAACNNLLLAFTADDTERLVASQIEELNRRYALEWLYDDFNAVNNNDVKLFPKLMTVRLLDYNNTKAKATLNFTRTEIDVPVNTDFRIQSGYKKLLPELFIKTLLND